VSIRIALHHRTAYRFDRPVQLGPHVVRLRPAPHCRTRVTSYSLGVEPPGHFLNWQQDPQGNHLARIVFPKPTRELVLTVDLVADLVAVNAFDFFLDAEAETFPFPYDPVLAVELAPYLAPPAGGEEFAALVAEARRENLVAPPRRTIDVLVALNRMVFSRIGYRIRMEAGVQAPEETLATRTGSCRDSAWLLVALLRQMGIAARFCSGYLVQLAPDHPPLDGPAGPTSDFTDLHAWAEAYLPGAGWIGLDPTSGLLAAEGHLPLAATPDPASAAPVSGLVEPCTSTMDVAMRVDRLAEGPRTTLPFPETAWKRIDGLGRSVDGVLAAGDVRLTSGGEPTYVSIDDYDAAEWNMAALGADKRRRAGVLARRLLADLAPGGVLLESQGKWYPGEPLPRWALELVWRADGVPLWQHDDLRADDTAAVESDSALTPDPGTILAALAGRLGIPPGFVISAHEQPIVDPAAPDAAPVIGPAVAWVLPLLKQRGRGPAVWRSSAWPVPLGKVFLISGDSPAGLRLPMGQLPWADEAEIRAGTSIVRTAIVAENRGGRLHVFLPPLDDTGLSTTSEAVDDWLDLIAALEATAVAHRRAVVLEGYAPPWDDRLFRLQVTPDPGVIEVNVPPAGSWEELVRIREAVDRAARVSRLGAEKFELDGRHTGTGGGDHLVLGGRTVADSPFLRRPDLLASLVAYWNNHPSLSYLFVRGIRRRRGWSTGCFAISSSISPATPTVPSSASTSSTPPTASPAGVGSWRCVPSRWRRTCGWDCSRSSSSGRSSPASGGSRGRGSSSAGGRRSTTASSFRTSCSPISTTCSPICGGAGSTSSLRGSSVGGSSVSRGSATWSKTASGWSCAGPSSPGMSSASSRSAGRRRGSSTVPSSECRCW
jgi:transglutaminase-like putative cysteine protease